MRVTYKKDRSIITILLSGELDEHSAEETRKSLDHILFTNVYKTVVYDLKGLTFMDSTGIGVLIGRYKQLKGRSIAFYVTNPNATINKIFKMSGLYEIMPLLD